MIKIWWVIDGVHPMVITNKKPGINAGPIHKFNTLCFQPWVLRYSITHHPKMMGKIKMTMMVQAAYTGR